MKKIKDLQATNMINLKDTATVNWQLTDSDANTEGCDMNEHPHIRFSFSFTE